MNNAEEPSAELLHWGKVVRSLAEGRLNLLARYLEQTGGTIDPDIGRFLVKMIDGRSSETGWRLRVEKHPALAPRAMGREQRIRRASVEFKIACFVARHGAIDGAFEAAIAEACTHFGLKRTKIAAAWSRHRVMATNKEKALRRLRASPSSVLDQQN